MNIVSKDNFKDDFERNRQEIKPDHTNEFNDQSENEETSFDIRDEQQHFPPRNASRRHRKRDLNSDDYQPQEHVQENSHNSHSEKRPGLLGGFVNKQQDTSHREDSTEPTRPNGQGEKIRDYAKEQPHEIQNQPKENHSNQRELKSEQLRDQRRDIHNPEKGKDAHRSNINNVSREDRAKREPHGQFKKSSEKDVNHAYSDNNSYSQEQQHKKVGPIAGGNQINHRENQTHPHTNEPNASQRLDNESKKIDQNHRQQPGNTRPDQRHTKFNKKAAAGAVGAAGVTGAVAKHEHDKKQREPLNNKNEKQNHARQQNDKIPNNKATSGAVGAAGTHGASQNQRHQHPNDRKRPTHEDERHSRNKKAAMGAGAVGAAGAGAAGAGAAGAHAAKQHKEKNQEPRKTNRTAATGAGVGAAGASASTQTAHTPPNNKRKKSGCLKRLLPLLAALLLLGALAIFGGMYLFNQNNDENHNNKDNQTEVAKKDNASKNKAENDKANKDKEKSTEETNSNETPGASSESSSEQSNQDTTQSDLNQQQNQSQQDPNSQAQTNSNQQNPSNTNQQNQNSASNNNAQSHTVTGNENLYRIAIRYYGSGSPENVEKIRRANGISGNNISNGQQLIIP